MTRRLTFIFMMGASFVLSSCQNMIGNLATNSSPNINPGGGGSNPSEEPAEASSYLRLGDRNFTGSFLTNLFVPTQVDPSETIARTELRSAIARLVTEQDQDLGGACDMFESNSYDCDGNFTKTRLPVFGPPTAGRASVTLKALYDLLNNYRNDMALRNGIALARSIPFTSLTTIGIQAPTSAELRAIFRLVYPDAEPSQETLDKMLTFTAAISQNTGNLNGWRYAFILVLSTMQWQLP
jgi:hypothetical protein